MNTDGLPIPAAEAAPAAAPLDALRRTRWLGAVPRATLEHLGKQAVLHRVPAGSMLFDQAETPAFATFLIGGSVELLAVRGEDEILIELVEPVDLLLPAAVLSRQPYLLRARVLEEARLMLVAADTFRHAVAADHALCLAVLACQAAQFRRQVKQVKNVRLRSAEERVGCYLLRLTTTANAGEPVRLPLEKRLIASQLGMTRETFSRSLGVVAVHGLRVEGEWVLADDIDAARARFPTDPLIDGAEAVTPLPLQASRENPRRRP
ncbi:MAG TPA: helix-turn-helix domain-containing protein [Acidisphaera sp.]|nr:helix-turn-helix domain-containing protein [Acidisphaera sp.]